MVVTTAQLHSTKTELRFCAGSNPARSVSEIRNGEDLGQWSRQKIRLNAFRRSTIPQKQFIIIIIITILKRLLSSYRKTLFRKITSWVTKLSEKFIMYNEKWYRFCKKLFVSHIIQRKKIHLIDSHCFILIICGVAVMFHNLIANGCVLIELVKIEAFLEYLVYDIFLLELFWVYLYISDCFVGFSLPQISRYTIECIGFDWYGAFVIWKNILELL